MPHPARRTQGPEDFRLKHSLHAIFASLTLLAAAPAFAAEVSAHPLLDFARERPRNPERVALMPAAGAAELREAEHALERAQAPPDAECAASLGARRYAELHGAVGVARGFTGDFAGAARAYRRAHACRPRDAGMLAALAGALFDARAYADARVAANAGLVIDPRDVSLNRIVGNLDYIDEHWADAIARFRYVAASDENREQAGYGQLMYYLAQMRAGMDNPQLVERTPGEGWPQPLLLYLRGEYSEAELIAPILFGDHADNDQPNTSTDERLCEALFYVGEAYLARGEPQVARDYFTALVNVKVLYFLEHGLALAEITKLRK